MTRIAVISCGAAADRCHCKIILHGAEEAEIIRLFLKSYVCYVQVLIGDEPEQGMENLMEVAIPENVEKGLVQASIKEQEELEKEEREQQQKEEKEEKGEKEEEKAMKSETALKKRKLTSPDQS